MAIFKRKKKQGSTESFKLVSDLNSPHVPFGSNISKSDVVKIAIDRIASQCAKLKPRYIKTLNDKTVTEKKGALSFILKHKPNEVMTPYQFIYKTITTLLMNDNAFIYPMFDSRTLELKGLYPLTPSVVEPMVDDKDNYYLKFYFENNDAFIIPYENIIHLKRFYHANDIFGGSNSNGDHDALLKTIGINENVLQGIDNALRSSMQIKGIVKMSAMLSEADKKKQLDINNLKTGDFVVAPNKKNSNYLWGAKVVSIDFENEKVVAAVNEYYVGEEEIISFKDIKGSYDGEYTFFGKSIYLFSEIEGFFFIVLISLAISLGIYFAFIYKKPKEKEISGIEDEKN